MKVSTLLTLILLTNTLGAQIFTEVPPALVPFAPVYSSAIAFADIDGDGDQDVLITGKKDQDTLVAELYTNDGSGNFTVVPGTPFPGVSESAVAFADIDGDGDQDVLVAGHLVSPSPGVFLSFIGLYTNDGAGNFTLVNGTPFIAAGSGTVDFADVDGDGDQDVLITGRPTGGPSTQSIARLFINDGSGTFTPAVGAAFTGVMTSAADFADVDGDGDLDVLITGNGWGSAVAALYINDGAGGFTPMPDTPFRGVYRGSVAFADIDGDGDQDVLLTGSFHFSGGPLPTEMQLAELYVNDGTGQFTLVSGTPFPESLDTSVAFDDVDEDGDMDLLIAGRETFGYTRLYINDGLGTFTSPSTVPASDFEPSYRGSVVFADVDGDGDRDVIVAGLYVPVRDTRLYINNQVADAIQEEPDRSGFSFNLYPNPASAERLSISYASNMPGNVDVRILDVDGRLISKSQQLSTGGDQTFLLDISALAKGAYLVQLDDGRRTGAQPFVVR